MISSVWSTLNAVLATLAIAGLDVGAPPSPHAVVEPTPVGAAAHDAQGGALAQVVAQQRGTSLVMGTPREGDLMRGDRQLRSGEFVDEFHFTGRARQRVTIDLDSSDFDTYVIVRGPNLNEENDDRGDGSTNSRVELELPVNGTYYVAVTSYTVGETGRYTVRVDTGGASSAPPLARQNRAGTPTPIADGDRANGELSGSDGQLTSGEYVDLFTFEGRTGDAIELTMRSADFDTYIGLIGPNGEQAANDDAPGLGTNARLAMSLPATGTYTVQATSFAPGETGSYTLAAALGGAAQASATQASAGGSPGAAELRVGDRVQGRLEDGDRPLRSGEWTDVWVVPANAGDVLDVSLQSSDFDTYLMARGPGGLNQENDDSEGTNSALQFRVVEDGPLRLIVTSYAVGETGDYTLEVNAAEGAAPTSVPRLTPGIAVRSELASDEVAPDGQRYERRFRFRANRGDRAVLQVAATAFDARVTLEMPNGDVEMVRDRDRRRRSEANLQTTLPLDGEYVAIVSSEESRATGAFAITLQLGDPDQAPTASARSGALAFGAPISGRLRRNDSALGSGEFYDSYTFQGSAGDGVTIEMTSTQVDTYLILTGPNGFQVDNDDGGDGTNSRLEAALPADGEYSVLATTYAPGETGGYEVVLREGTTVQQNARGQIYAVLAGITDYPGTGNDLPFCAEDATKLHESLASTGLLAPESVVLTDGQVTRAALESAFERVAEAAGPDDVFVFFYSGHGNTAPNNRELDGTDETLSLVDGDVTDDEVNDWFDAVDARMGLIALDSCFSGGFARDVISAPGRMGIFSSEEDVTSNVASRFQAGGYLSFFLRAAFEGAADVEPSDGILTAGELTQYLRRQWAQQNLTNETTQTVDESLAYQNLVIDRGSVKVDDVVAH